MRSDPGAVGGIAAAILVLASCVLIVIHVPGASAAAPRGGAFLGVASCAGSTCHGRSEGNGKVVRQDEIMRWQDPASAAGAHSRAFRVLAEPRSGAIARRLGIGDPAGEPMCLACHSTFVPRAARGPRFQLADGVGCESCHGPAAGWIASHYAVGGTHSANVSRGLVPLDSPRSRAAVCLDCHFGSSSAGQFVAHRLMAAGHPRLSFELDLFSTLQRHYDHDSDYRQRKRRAGGVQTWAVGQAMALDRTLGLFVSPGTGMDGLFPEFSFLDCHSCHRRIADDPGFQPTAAANPGRPIPLGMPPYNDENMIMLAAAARVLAPALAGRFEQESRAFHQAMAQGRPAMVAAAQRLRATARDLASGFDSAAVGKAQTKAIVDTIAGRAIADRFTDYAGSVQAVMATDSLLAALVADGHVAPAAARAIRPDIEAAYRAVRDPNAYRPGEFRASLGRAAATIRGL